MADLTSTTVTGTLSVLGKTTTAGVKLLNSSGISGNLERLRYNNYDLAFLYDIENLSDQFVVASDTTPENPQTGDAFVCTESGNEAVKVYNGTTWKTLGGIRIVSELPSNAPLGELVSLQKPATPVTSISQLQTGEKYHVVVNSNSLDTSQDASISYSEISNIVTTGTKSYGFPSAQYNTMLISSSYGFCCICTNEQSAFGPYYYTFTVGMEFDIVYDQSTNGSAFLPYITITTAAQNGVFVKTSDGWAELSTASSGSVDLPTNLVTTDTEQYIYAKKEWSNSDGTYLTTITSSNIAVHSEDPFAGAPTGWLPNTEITTTGVHVSNPGAESDLTTSHIKFTDKGMGGYTQYGDGQISCNQYGKTYNYNIPAPNYDSSNKTFTIATTDDIAAAITTVLNTAV